MNTADVKRWIENEMAKSYDYRAKPGTTKVIEDPRVPGTFAARFEDGECGNEEGIVDLLFITGHAPNADDPDNDASVLEAVLEEVEFESWPPMPGPLQSFM